MARFARLRFSPITLGVLLLLAFAGVLAPPAAHAALIGDSPATDQPGPAAITAASGSPAAFQPGAAAITTDALNLRADPSITATVQLVMPLGALVSVTGGPYNSVWYAVTYNGSTGFAHGGFLAPAPPVPTAPPVRLIIPSIGLDQRTVPSGEDAQGVGIVPKHDVGWFNQSAVPGQRSNVVFWGHVLRWLDSPNIPAPFANLSDLPVGAALQVVTSDGQVHRYKVARQLQVLPSEIGYIQPTSTEQVTLVSCIGDSVVRHGAVVNKAFRLITIAVPAP